MSSQRFLVLQNWKYFFQRPFCFRDAKYPFATRQPENLNKESEHASNCKTFSSTSKLALIRFLWAIPEKTNILQRNCDLFDRFLCLPLLIFKAHVSFMRSAYHALTTQFHSYSPRHKVHLNFNQTSCVIYHLSSRNFGKGVYCFFFFPSFLTRTSQW